MASEESCDEGGQVENPRWRKPESAKGGDVKTYKEISRNKWIRSCIIEVSLLVFKAPAIPPTSATTFFSMFLFHFVFSFTSYNQNQ